MAWIWCGCGVRLRFNLAWELPYTIHGCGPKKKKKFFLKFRDTIYSSYFPSFSPAIPCLCSSCSSTLNVDKVQHRVLFHFTLFHQTTSTFMTYKSNVPNNIIISSLNLVYPKLLSGDFQLSIYYFKIKNYQHFPFQPKIQKSFLH